VILPVGMRAFSVSYVFQSGAIRPCVTFMLFFFITHCVQYLILDSVLLVIIHPTIKNWLKYAKFEGKKQFTSGARRIFERAVEFYALIFNCRKNVTGGDTFTCG
jgi:HAT (Half-A-TPR) repeat